MNYTSTTKSTNAAVTIMAGATTKTTTDSVIDTLYSTIAGKDACAVLVDIVKETRDAGTELLLDVALERELRKACDEYLCGKSSSSINIRAILREHGNGEGSELADKLGRMESQNQLQAGTAKMPNSTASNPDHRSSVATVTTSTLGAAGAVLAQKQIVDAIAKAKTASAAISTTTVISSKPVIAPKSALAKEAGATTTSAEPPSVPLKGETMLGLTIDEEFSSLIPPSAPEELALLEESIRAEGVRDPLRYWTHEGRRILLDGHNCHRIAQKLQIAFKTTEIILADRDEARKWILRNQLGRRNLNPDQLSVLRGQLYNAMKRQDGGHGDQKSGGQNEPPIKTAEKLAAQYGVSASTIKRDSQYAEAVELLKSIDPEIVQKVLKGEAPSKSAIKAAAKIARKDPKAAMALMTGKKKAKQRKKKEEASPENPDTACVVIGGESLTTTEYCELMVKRLTEPGELCFIDRLANEVVEIVRHGSIDQLCLILKAIDGRMVELLEGCRSDEYRAVKDNIAKAVAAIQSHHLSSDSTLTGKDGGMHRPFVAQETK